MNGALFNGDEQPSASSFQPQQPPYSSSNMPPCSGLWTFPLAAPSAWNTIPPHFTSLSLTSRLLSLKQHSLPSLYPSHYRCHCSQYMNIVSLLPIPSSSVCCLSPWPPNLMYSLPPGFCQHLEDIVFNQYLFNKCMSKWDTDTKCRLRAGWALC